jgi:Mn-dependent DtxR family transcriptional regulator
MELLQQLSRRQVDALNAVRQYETAERGAPLASIAATLGVRPPSALDHLSALESLGLIERYRGKSRLTSRGVACLAEYRRHHRVAENMFRTLGLPPADTCDAAREVDLALSHRTVDRLCRAEGHPDECPHGLPIEPCASSRDRK